MVGTSQFLYVIQGEQAFRDMIYLPFVTWAPYLQTCLLFTRR